MFQTVKYKSGLIHLKTEGNTEEVHVQMNGEITPVKSFHAAKLFISRKEKKEKKA